MRPASLAALLAASALVAGCVALPPGDAPKSRVSPDYVASGDVSGVRAFIYGRRTVLEFETSPTWLSIKDEHGIEVPYEREGRYYLTSRRLNKFSLWLNTRALSFNEAPHAKPAVVPASSPSPGPAAPVLERKLAPLRVVPIARSHDASAFLELSAKQFDEAREAITAGSKSTGESKALVARLQRVEARLAAGSAGMLRVQFGSGRTEFAPSPEVAGVLIPVALAADRIKLHGRTDSRIPGPDDPKIALGRALAARQYLLDHGVDGAKVEVSSLPAGDFLAPASTAHGRALNRRVEIEFMSRRFDELRFQTKSNVEKVQ
jgi:outer membrane protein OmpA-like peptidoglycan-associated protein